MNKKGRPRALTPSLILPILLRPPFFYFYFDRTLYIVTFSSKNLSKKMTGNNNGWQSLLFDDVLKYSGHSREPFLLKPFEYRCLIGYWKNWWVGDPRSEGAEKYWRENPEESSLFKKALEDLHNNRIRFRIEFADGRNRIYHF